MDWGEFVRLLLESSVISKDNVFAVFNLERLGFDLREELKGLEVEFKGFDKRGKEILMLWGKGDWKNLYPHYKDIEAIAKKLGYKFRLDYCEGYSEMEQPLVIIFEDLGFVIAPKIE